ncbi:major capsid protein [Massilia sp. B-10]|nr:major capsid protein [Massilia sp. B-10]UUZ52714.1 major capsid protein [Massilia sp. H-1]
MNKSVRNFARGAFAVGSMAVAGLASAAIDISADTTAAKTDIGTAGGLIIGVVVAVAAISWIRRVIR